MSQPSLPRTAGLDPARSIGTAVFADTEPAALGQLPVFVVAPPVAAFAALPTRLAIGESALERLADTAGDRAE